MEVECNHTAEPLIELDNRCDAALIDYMIYSSCVIRYTHVSIANMNTELRSPKGSSTETEFPEQKRQLKTSVLCPICSFCLLNDSRVLLKCDTAMFAVLGMSFARIVLSGLGTKN